MATIKVDKCASQLHEILLKGLGDNRYKLSADRNTLTITGKTIIMKVHGKDMHGFNDKASDDEVPVRDSIIMKIRVTANTGSSQFFVYDNLSLAGINDYYNEPYNKVYLCGYHDGEYGVNVEVILRYCDVDGLLQADKIFDLIKLARVNNIQKMIQTDPGQQK